MSVAGIWKVDGPLAARWSLTFEDLALLNAKPAATRLGFAAQLVMYRTAGRFGRVASEFPDAAIAYLAEQVGAAAADLAGYDWLGRSGRRHRAEILAYLGFRRARQQDMWDAAAWTGAELCPLGWSSAEMMERLLGWFVDRRIAAPDEEALGSLIVTARRAFEDKVLVAISDSLSPEQCRSLDASLADEDGATGFSGLKADPGQPNLDAILGVAKRLAFLKQLALPGTVFPDLGGPVARLLRRRVFNETAWTMRRHPDGRRHALYALFLAHRTRELTDGLVDLLVEVVHKAGSQARKRVLNAVPIEALCEVAWARI
jgi:Domain of unknown function (DUF4158)